MSTTARSTEFRFRADKKTGYKRPTLTLNVPYPTVDYLKEVLQREESDKTREMVVDAVNGVIVNYLRGKVNDNSEFSQEDLEDLVAKGKLDIDAIANLPRSQRNTITNADLSAFAASFIEVATQVEATEQRIASEAGAKVAAATFADRLRGTVGKDEVLDRLATMLEAWCEAAPDEVVEEHQAVVEWLAVKLEEGKEKKDVNLGDLD